MITNSNPNYEDLLYRKRKDVWFKMDKFRFGEPYTFLHKYEDESEEDFKLRQKHAEFLNLTKKTINTSVGILFRNEIMYETKKLVSDFKFENVDREYSSLNEFIKQVTILAFWHGISYVLVDLPRVDEKIKSLKEQKDKE